MEEKHLSDDQLIAQLYGALPPDPHLEGCPDCADRWRRLLAGRRKVLESPGVAEAFLHEQRVRIYRRLETGAARPVRFAAAFSVVVVVVLALVISAPAPPPAPSIARSDAEIFAEVFEEASSTEPRALQPIRGLFEVAQ